MAQRYVFDTEKWGALIGRAREAIATDVGADVPGRLELAELMDVSPVCIDAWETRTYKGSFEYPQMTNMLRMCNLTGFNPCDLFTLIK